MRTGHRGLFSETSSTLLMVSVCLWLKLWTTPSTGTILSASGGRVGLRRSSNSTICGELRESGWRVGSQHFSSHSLADSCELLLSLANMCHHRSINSRRAPADHGPSGRCLWTVLYAVVHRSGLPSDLPWLDTTRWSYPSSWQTGLPWESPESSDRRAEVRDQ